MLDIPLIQTGARTSRAEAQTTGTTPADQQPRDADGDDFDDVMAAQTREETSAEPDADGSENQREANDVTPVKLPAVPRDDSAPAGELSAEAGAETTDADELADGTDEGEKSPADAAITRGKTASELAVLQQAGISFPQKPASDGPATPPARAGDTPLVAGTNARKPAPEAAMPTKVLGQAGAVKNDGERALAGTPVPAPTLRQQAPSDSVSRTSPQALAVGTEDTTRQPVPGTPVQPSVEVSEKRTDRTRRADAEPRVMPTAAAAQTDIRKAMPQPANQPVNPGLLHVNRAGGGEKSELMPTSIQDPESVLQWDARTTAPGATQQTVMRADTPAMIGRQMAETLQRLPDRPVELALSPKELGNVRMSISAADGSITVSVLAERPETLDLMRRNIDQLAREFQSLGFENISFAFSEGQQQTNEERKDGATHMTDAGPVSEDEATDTIVQPIELIATTGLDLRL